MKKKYVIRDFDTGNYWGGDDFGFCTDSRFAHKFDTEEIAESFMSNLDGLFIIETVYTAYKP